MNIANNKPALISIVHIRAFTNASNIPRNRLACMYIFILPFNLIRFFITLPHISHDLSVILYLDNRMQNLLHLHRPDSLHYTIILRNVPHFNFHILRLKVTSSCVATLIYYFFTWMMLSFYATTINILNKNLCIN